MKWYWIVLIAYFGPAVLGYIFEYITLKLEYRSKRKSWNKHGWGNPDPITIRDLVEGTGVLWWPVINVGVALGLLFNTLDDLGELFAKLREKIYNIKI